MSDDTIEQKSASQEKTAVIDETAARTAGQRRVNIIWEVTQAFIAIAVTTSGLVVIILLVRMADKIDAAMTMLNSAFFTVVGFYFGRTNHQRIGGVGGGDQGR